MLILITYACYLITSVGMAVWVARSLHKNGRIFLIESFSHNDALADSVNHMLVVGFYLINLGYIALTLKYGSKPFDVQTAIEFLSTKIGFVMLVLGAMHFFNLYVINRIRRQSRLRLQPPPVMPDGHVPSA